MPEGIIDLLEIIQVNKQQGGLLILCQRRLYPTSQPLIVQQPGQRIGLGLMIGVLQLFLAQAFLQIDVGYIRAGEQYHPGVAVVVTVAELLSCIAPDWIRYAAVEGMDSVQIELFQHSVNLHLPYHHLLIFGYDIIPGILYQGGSVVIADLRRQGSSVVAAAEHDITVILRIQINKIITGVVDIQVNNALQKMFFIRLAYEYVSRYRRPCLFYYCRYGAPVCMILFLVQTGYIQREAGLFAGRRCQKSMTGQPFPYLRTFFFGQDSGIAFQIFCPVHSCLYGLRAVMILQNKYGILFWINQQYGIEHLIDRIHQTCLIIRL